MQIQEKKNIREGNFYFPGTTLKQIGHCFINSGRTQIGHPNLGFV